MSSRASPIRPERTSPDRGDEAMMRGSYRERVPATVVPLAGSTSLTPAGPDDGLMVDADADGMFDALRDYHEQFDDRDLLKFSQQIESQAMDSMGELRKQWTRSLRAFHSKHWTGSKYWKEDYLSRSRLFRPRTRSAVRKNQATAASALFSNTEVVSIKATMDDDEINRASADVIHAALNLRLDRSTPQGGVPWFRVAMAANFDAQLQGVCVSKQGWNYRTLKKKVVQDVPRPVTDPATGAPVINPLTGGPFTQIVQQEVEEIIVLEDRPMVKVYPPEHAWLDSRADWLDPVQSGGHFTLREPISVGDLKAMMRSARDADERQLVEWRDPDDEQINWRSALTDYDSQGNVQAERNSTKTPDAQTNTQLSPDKEHETVWLHENFCRIDGEDYHWYSLGTREVLSYVACVRDVYPAHHGLRPAALGYGSLEPHVLYPQSQVESWQPLQEEANDITNLHLDALRQSIEPMAKVRSGTMPDMKQLRKRGSAGATMTVHNMDDLEFDRAPEPSGQVYTQVAHLNAEFDELAGVFSGASVSTNRQLNETVGGMRMLTGAANATTEYDLRVWVETWVEVVLRQLVQLIQYYETDERLLAVAGQKAQLMTRYNIDKVTDDMLEAEVAVSVNVGLGATDPMQRLQKLGVAMQMIREAAQFADKPVKVKIEDLIQETMGAIGYKEGMRFFEIGGEVPKSPEEAKAEMDMAIKTLDVESRERIAQGNNASQENRELLKAMASITQELIEQEGEKTRALVDMRNRQGDAAMRTMTTLASGAQKNRSAERTAMMRGAAKQPPKRTP